MELLKIIFILLLLASTAGATVYNSAADCATRMAHLNLAKVKATDPDVIAGIEAEQDWLLDCIIRYNQGKTGDEALDVTTYK